MLAIIVISNIIIAFMWQNGKNHRPWKDRATTSSGTTSIPKVPADVNSNL